MGIEFSDRVLFSRRRALALAGTGLGSLALAGCGDSSASDASGSDAGSQSSSSPSPSKEKKYSGGSKAPDGEYRLADELGPAQNVPEPPQPEDGYTVPSVEGLRKSLFALEYWHNYGIQTGDFTVASQFIDSSQKDKIKLYKDIHNLYFRGGWVIDGILKYKYVGNPLIFDGEMYLWKVTAYWNKYIIVHSTGNKKVEENTEYNRENGYTQWIECHHNGREWGVTGRLSSEKFAEKYKDQLK